MPGPSESSRVAGARRRASLFEMRASHLVVLALVVGCGDNREQVDKPTPPDMTEVVQTYASPTGVFDANTAKAALDQYQAVAARVRALGIDTSVLIPLAESFDEALAQSSTSKTQSGQSQQALELEANGTLVVQRICRGWNSGPAPDPKNGTLRLRVNFSEAGLDPVVWGDATACHYLVGGVAEVSIDEGSGRPGDVRLWVGHSATFENFGKTPVLLDIDLAVEIDGVAEDLAANFQWDPVSLRIAVAIETATGTVVVSGATSGPLGVLAINGHFDCEIAPAQCTSDTGQSFAY